MWPLIIGGVAYVFLIGYLGCNDIDKYIYNNQLKDNKPKAKILLYGSDKKAKKIRKMLLNKNILFNNINDIQEIENNNCYKALIAASNDDLENLLICSNAIKSYNISNVILICNKIQNGNIFLDGKIKTIFSDNKNENEIYYDLMEKLGYVNDKEI